MSGSAGLFSKKKIFFYLVGSPKVGGAGDGKHKKKYGHPNGYPQRPATQVQQVATAATYDQQGNW